MDEPVPSADPPEDDSARPVDPGTGDLLPVADMREEFARLSREAPDQAEAHRAFVASKIGLIRTDRLLSKAQKEAAVAELLARLEGPR